MIFVIILMLMVVGYITGLKLPLIFQGGILLCCVMYLKSSLRAKELGAFFELGLFWTFWIGMFLGNLVYFLVRYETSSIINNIRWLVTP